MLVAVPAMGQTAGSEPNDLRVGLRTNVLMIAAGVANAAVEVPLGSSFSVAGELSFARWRMSNMAALHVAAVGAEVKFWPSAGSAGSSGSLQSEEGRVSRRVNQKLTGFNVGVHATYAQPWEVQWGEGWQGDQFFVVGAMVGYSLPITDRMNAEAVLGAGWFYTPEARHYVISEKSTHTVWQQTRRNVGRVGVTRAAINLVWRLGR